MCAEAPSLLVHEETCWSRGMTCVAGIDEAGRGPLAGPVVAAAVIFDPAYIRRECAVSLLGLTDSKKLSPKRREAFFSVLSASDGVTLGVGSADVEEIDRFNILRATHMAMARAVAALSLSPEHVLVDGRAVDGLPCTSTAIVKGDSKSLSIAAASVVAKVVRDREMLEMDTVYPAYGFAQHKGYGSRDHIQALFEHGPSPIHRMTFRPVREAGAIHHAS